MTATAVDTRTARATRFWQSHVGKKAIMAVTGFILFGYLVGHMLGNLQIFMGADKINHYAEFLHTTPSILWTARVVLLISVILHVTAAIQLTMAAKAARPVGYRVKKNAGASVASRTMIVTGFIILAFVVFHILNMTTGTIHPNFQEVNGVPIVYDNLTTGLSVPWVAAVYIIAMIALLSHLFHGLWSMFQSVGVHHPKYTPGIKMFAAVFSFIIAVGFISVPVAILAHVIGG